MRELKDRAARLNLGAHSLPTFAASTLQSSLCFKAMARRPPAITSYKPYTSQQLRGWRRRNITTIRKNEWLLLNPNLRQRQRTTFRATLAGAKRKLLLIEKELLRRKRMDSYCRFLNPNVTYAFELNLPPQATMYTQPVPLIDTNEEMYPLTQQPLVDVGEIDVFAEEEKPVAEEKVVLSQWASEITDLDAEDLDDLDPEILDAEIVSSLLDCTNPNCRGCKIQV